jgi:uncharacterized protein
MNSIIGRKEATAILNAFVNSKSPEFLALYGRRRIGKTFLIKHFFKAKKLVFFNITGEKDAPMKKQIKHFTKQMSYIFYNGARLVSGKNWDESFEMLTEAFKSVGKKEKIVLFFDEFPWMATQNSRLLQGLDYYWNQHWSNDDRIKLIICGSAASWIIDNIVNNKGGLHNRITRQINLEPLNLPETKQFLKEKSIVLSNKQIVDLYMSMGGVPYYLNQVEKGKSSTQVIESLAFKRNGFLLTEFNNLFASLFKNSGIYEEIIKTIASCRYGIGKRELLEKISKSLVGKGGLEKLKALKDTGFILDFKPHLHKEKGVYYKLIDNYSLFYLYWIFPVHNSLLVRGLAKGYWNKMKKSSSWYSWSGLAFEAICYEHLPQISKALDLSPTAIPTTWRYIPRKDSKENGAQIDLLFDRDDDAITICEIKYTNKPFTITREYAEKLQKKLDTFRRVTRIKKQLFLVIISSAGVKKNKYSDLLLSGIVTLDDLFKEI